MWAHESNNKSSEILACRGCLASDVKLYNIHLYKLAEPYDQLIGFPLMPSVTQLDYVCSFCRMLLIKFSKFRTQCRKAQEVFTDAMIERKYITKSYIHDLSMHWPELKPNYTQARTETQEYVCTEDKLEDIVLKQEFLDTETKIGVYVDKIELESEQEIDSDLEMNEPLKIFVEDYIKQKEVKKECRVPTKKRRKPAVKKENKKGSEESIKEFAKSVNFDVIFLTKEQQIEEIEDKKKEFESTTVKKCNHCGKNFLNQDTFDVHYKNYHDPSIGKFVCDICNTYFKPRRNYLVHMRIHGTKFCCKTCGFTTKIRDTLKRHYEFHEGKSHICQYCKKAFGKVSSYFTHIRLKHASELNWCELCGESFIGQQGIAAHKYRMHRDVKNTDYTCDKCNKNFLNNDALKKHEGFNKCDVFSCIKCGDNFVTEQLLKYHLIQHRNDQNLECENCKVRFLNLAALNKHEDVCEGAGCVCVQCGESFKTDELLNEHVVELHTVGDEFRCEECDRSFTNAFYFREHFGKFHKNRSGKIRVKRKKADQNPKTPKPKRWRGVSHTLRKWKVVDEHEEGKNVVMEKQGPDGEVINKKTVSAAVCEVCGKSFLNAALMKYHQRIHTGEKIYQCTECPKHFLRKQTLLEHMRVHTGERPFLCGTCPKAFKTLAGLSRHNLIHSDTRRHVCQLCDKTFRTSTCVKIHIKTVHMKLPMPPRNRRRNRIKDE